MTDPNSIFKPGVYHDTCPGGLTDEERRWARNLLQGDNLDRLNRANRTGRRFRPVPVSIHYECWYVSGDRYSSSGWRIDRVENGRRTDHRYFGDIESEINRLRATGFMVKEIAIDGAPPLFPTSRGSCVKRKLFMERFKNFDKIKR